MKIYVEPSNKLNSCSRPGAYLKKINGSVITGLICAIFFMKLPNSKTIFFIQWIEIFTSYRRNYGTVKFYKTGPWCRRIPRILKWKNIFEPKNSVCLTSREIIGAKMCRNKMATKRILEKLQQHFLNDPSCINTELTGDETPSPAQC